jgi:predicted ABC-type ATPase
LADYALIFDNSSAFPALVYERTNDGERIILPDLFRTISQQAEAAS